ncbi:MAG: hypothetical protein KME29_09060 [Calothrix sp. FI2-JRJ7]|jgi:hypothetical protein|nr:hypothetical protein [Calothrix sp. FI2-JRJ7]
MPYSSFSLQDVVEQFSLTLEERIQLFTNVEPVKPSDFLMMTLDENVPLATAINTEKARGELIIFPVLLEVKRKSDYSISLFSGKEFNVDITKGLNGSPDFLISTSPEQYYIKAPVMVLVEAKNQDINSGLGQCASEMIAAQIFNQKNNQTLDTIYGCITTGILWKFLKLEQQKLYIDIYEIALRPIDHLLGIFMQILN